MLVLFALIGWGVTVGLIGGLVLAARRGRPADDAGTLTFRHGWPLRAFAVSALAGGLALFGVSGVLYPPTTPAAAAAMTALAGLLFVGGGLVLWEAFRFGLVVRPDELDHHSPWKGRRVFLWSAADRLTFSGPNAWFTLHMAGGDAVRVSAVVPGIGRFLEACEARLPAEKLAGAKRGYAWAGRRWPGK